MTPAQTLRSEVARVLREIVILKVLNVKPACKVQYPFLHHSVALRVSALCPAPHHHSDLGCHGSGFAKSCAKSYRLV